MTARQASSPQSESAMGYSAAQAELEAQPEGDFDAFVAAYQASILALAV
ncbi:MAG: hypothetical protein IIZ69_08165 [Pseudomonas sp.]|nr:hypothetical protein [Pseudomonas sp.]